MSIVDTLRGWWTGDDDTDLADRLIGANRWKWREGMQFADLERIDQLGSERWREAERAQRRLAK